MLFKHFIYYTLVFVSVAIHKAAAACSHQSIVRCIDPLLKKYAEPAAACQAVDEALKCVDRELKNCDLPQYLTLSIRQEMNRWKDMCSITNGDKKAGQEMCSSKDIVACVKPLHAVVQQNVSIDMSMACLTIHQAVECVQKEFDTCPKHLQSYLDQARRQLNSALTMCNPYRWPPMLSIPPRKQPQTKASTPGTTVESKYPCHWSTIRDCVWPLDQLVSSPFHSDRMMMCQMYEKSSKCLEKEQALCPGLISTHMWSAQIAVDRAGMLCDQTKTTKQPKQQGQIAMCVSNKVMSSCMLHSQLPDTDDGKRRTEPLGPKDICFTVGRSLSCIEHKTRDRSSCDPSLVTRMAGQLEEQKSQCKQLGYPTINKAIMKMQPAPVLTLTLATMSAIVQFYM